MKRITCPKLTKLVLKWDSTRPIPEVAFPVVKCQNLFHLEMYGYAHLMSSLPSILAVLPHLESLKVGDSGVRWEEMVIEHSCIRVLVFKKSTGRSLILIMPRLKHVDVGVTELDMLKVTSTEITVTVYFNRVCLIPKREERRRSVFPGGGMRAVDLSDAKQKWILLRSSIRGTFQDIFKMKQFSYSANFRG